jgi:hypothetical protein
LLILCFFFLIVPNRLVVVVVSPSSPRRFDPVLQITLRAGARRRGVGAVVSPPPSLSLVSSSSLALLLPVSTPRAVARSGGWGCCVLLVVPVMVPAPVVPRRPSLSAVSTRDPPCEQWLAGLGAGAGSLLVVGVLMCPVGCLPAIHPASRGSQRWRGYWGVGRGVSLYQFCTTTTSQHCLDVLLWCSFWFTLVSSLHLPSLNFPIFYCHCARAAYLVLGSSQLSISLLSVHISSLHFFSTTLCLWNFSDRSRRFSLLLNTTYIDSYARMLSIFARISTFLSLSLFLSPILRRSL